MHNSMPTFKLKTRLLLASACSERIRITCLYMRLSWYVSSVRVRVRVCVCLCVSFRFFPAFCPRQSLPCSRASIKYCRMFCVSSLACSIFQCYVLRVRVMENTPLLLSLVLMRVCLCVLWFLTCVILRLFEGGWPRYAPACELREVEQTVR